MRLTLSEDGADGTDGDPDAEDGGDAEPSLTAPCGGSCQVIWAIGDDP